MVSRLYHTATLPGDDFDELRGILTGSNPVQQVSISVD